MMVIEDMAKYKKQEKNTEFDKSMLIAKALYKHINYNNVIGVRKLMEYKFLKEGYKQNTLSLMLTQARNFVTGRSKNFTNLSAKIREHLQRLKDTHYATLTPKEDEKMTVPYYRGEKVEVVKKEPCKIEIVKQEIVEDKKEETPIVDINPNIIKVKAICDFLVNDYKCELPGSRENREKYGKYILAKQILEMI